jgi:hypothetical protein
MRAGCIARKSNLLGGALAANFVRTACPADPVRDDAA